MEHEREGATPQGDGTLLGDCSCGAAYIVPQSDDEFGALEAAQAAHVLGAVIPPTAGVLAVFTPEELEALVVTLADVWQHGAESVDLSARQVELAHRACEYTDNR